MDARRHRRLALAFAMSFAVLCTGCRGDPCRPCAPPPCAPPAAAPQAPCAVLPAPDPCWVNPCSGGTDKPCSDWPDYAPSGELTAGQMLSSIIQEATLRQAGASPMVKKSWQRLEDDAGRCSSHGSSCSVYTCQQYWTKVDSCYQAVIVHPPAAGAPAPACSELNHVDPTNFPP